MAGAHGEDFNAEFPLRLIRVSPNRIKMVFLKEGFGYTAQAFHLSRFLGRHKLSLSTWAFL